MLRAPIISLATFWSFLVLLATIPDAAPWIRSLLVGVFGLSLLWPTGGLVVFLFFLGVIGGDGPGKPLTILYYEIFSAHLLGLLTRLAIHRDENPNKVREVSGHPAAFLLILFVVSGALSLIGLPHEDLLAEWEHIEFHWVTQFLGLHEFSPLMPFLDVFYQIQCLALFFVIADYPRGFRGGPKVWALSILLGSLAILTLGLMEFYGLISLRQLPLLGVFLNPAGFDRLQSFFGNPTWYAEYLTVIAPYSMVLLLLNYPQRIRLLAVILVLIITEISLILTMSRGGWLSYPLTLIAMWIAYYTLVKDKGEARPRRLVILALIKKVGISIPLTLAVSLSLVGYLNSIPRGEIGGMQGPGTDAYVARAQEMKDANERLRYFHPMKTLLAEHPIFGGGLNSWGYRLIHEYLKPDGGHFGADMNFGHGGRIEYGSAHNLYFQTLAGKGIVGLIIVLSLIGTTILLASRNLLNHPGGHLSSDQKILSMMMLAYLFAFAIYGNVQEGFYVPALSILFFVSFGIFVNTAPPAFEFSHRIRTVISGLLLSALVGHIYWEFQKPGVTRLADTQKEFGCYDFLGEHEGSTAMWCGSRFRVSRPYVVMNGSPRVFSQFLLETMDPNVTGVTLRASFGSRVLTQATIPAGNPVWLSMSVSEGIKDAFIPILFEADRTFVPAKNPFSGSGDVRTLAIQKTYQKLPALLNLERESDCKAIPQWQGSLLLSCTQGGRIDATGRFSDSEKVSIELPWHSASPESPAWLLIQETSGQYREIALRTSRWQSFKELGIVKMGSDSLRIRVLSSPFSRDGVLTPAPEAIPFAMMIKP